MTQKTGAATFSLAPTYLSEKQFSYLCICSGNKMAGFSSFSPTTTEHQAAASQRLRLHCRPVRASLHRPLGQAGALPPPLGSKHAHTPFPRGPLEQTRPTQKVFLTLLVRPISAQLPHSLLPSPRTAQFCLRLTAAQGAALLSGSLRKPAFTIF